MAVAESYEALPPYLYGQHFQVRTEQASMCWHKLSNQTTRWFETLAEFQFKLNPKQGPVMKTPVV